MSMSRMAALLAGLLLVPMFANAASRNNTIQLKVLDSETRSLSVDDNNGVPLNCEQLTFDAYCRSSRTAPLVNTLVVQEGNNPPFRISCTAQSKYSRCIPLPKDTSFDARREKKGVTVYYVDDKGKLRSQLYTLVAGDAKGKSAATATKVAPVAAPASSGPAVAAPANPASDQNAGQARAANGGPAAAANAEPAQAVEIATESSSRETVKCSFSSTPAGAEVTVDGRYVGSTPSVLGLTTGTHVVVVSMAGFTQWKRELTVEAGSELTVNAVLEKAR